ncbi:MAG: phosphoglycerate dehydrogenase [Lachnospiraceae bacterium]
MYQFHCLNPISCAGLDLFGGQYKRTEQFENADVVLVRSAAMHDLELSENLLAVARAGAGVNNIPLDKCAENGTVVFNTPGANANGVKELVIAGMLLASRDIVGGINWVREFGQDQNIAKLTEKQKKHAGSELKGKRLGIIGLGAIGVCGKSAISLGMEVYGYDPYISVDAAWHLSEEIRHIRNVEEIYKNCDFITIHVPLLDSTRGMIDKDAISLMKNGVVVLNFARDVLVNEEDMVSALASGKVRKYVSDFPNATTAACENCIVIPHLGASTEESEDNCAAMAVRELKDFLENGNITNSVNLPSCSMGVCEKVGRVSIIHKNISNMIAKFTAVFGDSNVNISDMTNKSKNDYAYSLIDVEAPITSALVDQLRAIDGVIRVRVIK